MRRIIACLLVCMHASYCRKWIMRRLSFFEDKIQFLDDQNVCSQPTRVLYKRDPFLVCFSSMRSNKFEQGTLLGIIDNNHGSMVLSQIWIRTKDLRQKLRNNAHISFIVRTYLIVVLENLEYHFCQSINGT